MAAAKLSAADSEKLSKLQSAVSGLSEIRWKVFLNFFFIWGSDTALQFTTEDLSYTFVICSENEKSGFINLVSRSLRYGDGEVVIQIIH